MRKIRDITEKWLKENDPEYGKNKLYMNNDRFRWVTRKEIPTGLIDRLRRESCV